MALRAAGLVLWICAGSSLAALVPPVAGAVPAAGISGARNLATFDTAAPAAEVRVRPINGLETASETAIGLDTRPATGELFMLTVPTGTATFATVRTYRLDVVTATAALVGATPGNVPLAGDRPSGVDFQPLVDRIRVVQANNENFRVNPNNGALSGDDSNLTYTAPATGPVVGAAYDRNVAPGPPGTVAAPGARTTLYEVDAGSDRLVVQGGVDGAGPGGANGGTVTAVGPLGVSVDDASDAGFDITPDGTAYASLRVVGLPGLYKVDLTTGAATLVGNFPLTMEIRALTVLAPDNCPTVAGDDQADLDGDGVGDACDGDIDGDGVSNDAETARGSDPRSGDSDGDGKGDGADACPTLAAATANGCPAAAVGLAPPADTTAPTVTLSRTASRLTRKRFLSGVASRIAVGEPSSLQVALLGRARSAGLARAGDIVLAERNFGMSAAVRSVKLKPNRRLVGRRKRFTVRLRVIATDAAGNRRTATKAISVR